MAQLIDGKRISADIRAELKEQTEKFIAATGIKPKLTVILVGEDPASQVYVRNKGRACEEIGFAADQITLPATTTQEELDALVDRLNADKSVHGILVQLPLPRGLSEERVLLRIAPEKDVDAFHPYNVGRMVAGQITYLPCTPAGVMELITRSGISVAGKDCVVIGRSNIVGKPQAALLMQKAQGANATVTVVHSGSKNLEDFVRSADIVIAAIGKPEFVRGNMIKPGAVVVDVGINRVQDANAPKGYKVVGDVCFDEVKEVASAITPVPGGVGPMTIAMLMRNTVKAARLQCVK